MVDENVIILGRGDFFAIDRRAWAKACDIGGMNAPLAYLVLARGAGGDNRTTSWSAEAINYRTNVNWRKAKEAISTLIKAGLVRQDKGGRRPRYYLMLPAPSEAEKPEWIWIPNALVDGAADETPPIELVRQSNRPAALRLLIDLYGAQSLIDYGGVHWRQLRQSFDRTQVAERGAYVIWGFSEKSLQAWGHVPFVKPHLTGKFKDSHDTGWPIFWDALSVLTQTGLVEFVEHIVDSDIDEGAVLHPYAASAGEPGECEIGRAAGDAAISMLAEWRQDLIDRGSEDHGLLLPALNHLRDVQMVGIARLKYRARTSATAAWLSNSESWAQWVTKYEAMQSGDLSAKVVLQRLC